MTGSAALPHNVASRAYLLLRLDRIAMARIAQKSGRELLFRLALLAGGYALYLALGPG